MSPSPLDPRSPFGYLTPERPDQVAAQTIDSTGSAGRVGFYDNDDQARIAVKLLVNAGFDAEHVFVLSSNKMWKGDSLATRIYVGPPENDASIYYMTATGASMGAASGALLAVIAAWPIAVIAAGVAGVAGGAIGAMIGAGTFGDDETHQLADLYHDRIEKGNVVVVVKPKEGEDPAKMERAAELLSAAATETE